MYSNLVKPFFDYSISLIAFMVFLPLIVLIYLVSRAYGVKNPFFLQARPGKNERVFHIVKFKTMTDETDENGSLLPDDRRLTGLGGMLRKTSMDELPQFINVLKGDMSLVGPRPLRVRYLPWYTGRERLRHSVKPGITGLAQVSGRNAISWDERLELDARYAEKQGFGLDLNILLKTLLKVFKSSETEFSAGPDSFDEYRMGNDDGKSGAKEP